MVMDVKVVKVECIKQLICVFDLKEKKRVWLKSGSEACKKVHGLETETG